MARSKTDSFILELKLKASPADGQYLEACFAAGARTYNTMVRYCRRQIASLRQDKAYRGLLETYRSLKKGKRKTEVSRQLSEIVTSYGLTEYGLHGFVKVQQHRYKKYINSLVAQKIASSVWKGVEKVLYGNGKQLHFRKYMDFTSLEGKNNGTGIVFHKNVLTVNGHPIQVQRHKKDGSSQRKYEEEALTHRTKYCRLVRKPVGGTFHYYVQLVLEGRPPRKGRTLGKGDSGLDIGTSTVAVVNRQECILTVIAGEIASIEKEKRRIQRKMDRSRRAMNPVYYNPDGTIRKRRKKWAKSKQYRRLEMKYASLCRKRSAALKQWQEAMANRIIAACDTLYTETMNFQALQRRAKHTTRRGNGKYARRKRFGKSLQARAPAQFCGILKRKLESLGGKYLEVDTKAFRASQYNHVTDTYTKKKLSRRHNMVDGHWVQRDLYSAFLLMNSAITLDHSDRDHCNKNFEAFLQAHDACIERIRNTKTKIPYSFGFRAA